MITDPKFLASEIRRLEDNSLTFSPERQWQIVGVTFPSRDGQDVDVIHSLNTTNPDNVDVQLLSSNAPLMIFRGTGPWSTGLIRLRGTAPGAQAVLLLSVAEDAGTREAPATQPLTSGFGTGGFQNVPLVGYNGALHGAVRNTQGSPDFFSGPGLNFNGYYYGFQKSWQLGLYGTGGSDLSLNLHDVDADVVPFMWRKFGGDYYFQPGPGSAALGMIANLGNPFDSFKTGWWNSLYARTVNVEGMQFPATQAASADPNNLDDYEEGTWTPFLTSLGGGSGTYTTQYGEYIKIGQFVHVWGYISLSSKAGFSAGQLVISGLPFVIASGSVGFAMGVTSFSGLTTSVSGIVVYTAPAQTNLGIAYVASPGATSTAVLQVSDISNTLAINFAGSFRASA